MVAAQEPLRAWGLEDDVRAILGRSVLRRSHPETTYPQMRIKSPGLGAFIHGGTQGLGNDPGGNDPLHSLVRHGGNEIEVVVVVEYHEPSRLGRSGDEQVGDLGTTLLAAPRQRVLHV